jgi:chitodextrinase
MIKKSSSVLVVALATFLFVIGVINIAKSDGLAPNAPSNINTYDITSNSISITWTDNSNDEDGFVVEESINGSDYFTVGSVMTDVINFTIPELRPNTEYWFRVAAFRGETISDYATMSEGVFTLPYILNAPSDIIVNLVETNDIDISWTDNSKDEEAFIIDESTNGLDYTNVGEVAADVNNFTIPNLSPNTEYWFRVAAYNNEATSDYATMSEGVFTLSGALNAPSDITVNMIGTDYENIIWTDNSSDEDGFTIDESNDGSNYYNVGTVMAEANNFTIPNLQPNTRYWFRVAAIRGADISDYSTTPNGSYTNALAPNSFEFAWHNDNNSLDIGWSGGVASSYIIFYTDSNSGFVTDNYYTLNNLACNTYYEFSIVGFGENQQFTDRVNFNYTTGTCLPIAPTEVTATLDSPSAITVAWSGGSGSAYLASYTESDFGTITSGWITDSSYQFTDLSCSTEYTFGVVAINEDGVQTDPVYVTQKTPACLQDPPSSLTAVADSPNSITVSWSDSGYNYYANYNDNEGSGSGWINGGSYQFTNLTCNTEYTFSVVSKNEDDVQTDPTFITQTTKACPPTAPTEVTATADSPTAITVNWSGGTASGYKASYSGADSGWTTEAFYQFTGLTCNTSYTFNVIAKNEDDVQTDPTFITQTTKACSVSFSGGGGIIYTTPVKPIIIPPVITPPIITTPPITNPTKPVIIKKFIFKKNLKLGDINNDVKELQKYLNAHGFIVAKIGAGSRGKETTKFGAATKAALIKFQKAKKIKPTNGLFGPLTRAAVNK